MLCILQFERLFSLFFFKMDVILSIASVHSSGVFEKLHSMTYGMQKVGLKSGLKSCAVNRMT